MEQNYSDYLKKLKPISQAANEIIDYIDKKRKGLIRSLKTRWVKFNSVVPIEWNCLYLLCGISGSGKSSIANELETALFDYNRDQNFAVLSFNYEMLSSKQVGRKLSFKSKKSVSELYSTNQNLDDNSFEELKKHADNISKYRIYYSDIPDTVDGIEKTIIALYKTINIPLVIFLDHTRLVKNIQGKSEFDTLNDLANLCVKIKKQIKCSVFLISQLNREIEKPERAQKPQGHFPQRSDLFGADSLYQGADYVMVAHRPELLHIKEYGVEKLPTKDRIYLHILKNRDGEVGIIPYFNNLQYNKIDEL